MNEDDIATVVINRIRLKELLEDPGSLPDCDLLASWGDLASKKPEDDDDDEA